MMAFVVLAVAAGGYAYRVFYRTKPSGSALQAEFKTTASQLIAAFYADEKSASGKYTGHALEVGGLFKAAELFDNAHPVIVMQDNASPISIRFSLDSNFHSDFAQLKPGLSIRMKGVCIGLQSDDMGLGADILFDRSIILSTENPKP